MNKTLSAAIELTNGLKRELYDIEDIDMVICPPYTALSEVSELIYNSNIHLGAQDMCWEQEGAFTGEISGLMLKDIGCKFVIIGHSERRQFFGETNESINKKIKSAIKIGLIPIVCVGENLNEREAGYTFDIVKEHIEKSLKGLTNDDISKIVIAYEPVWAIGTGKTATAKQAQEVQGYIRILIAKLYNERIASDIRIQYGGSVKPDNIKELMEQNDIDGALVGGASLDLNSFVQIIKNSRRIK